MSKRFGRNQKRRMREEIAIAKDDARFIAARAKEYLDDRNQAMGQLRDMQRMLEEIAGMVGRKSLAAGNPTRFEANWLKTGQKNFRLPAPIFAQTNYCYGGPSRQEIAVMAHDEIMRLLEVDAVRDPISRAMHVRVMFDDIAMGYALSDSALHAMPEEVLAEKMINELFPLLKDAIRQLKGNR